MNEPLVHDPVPSGVLVGCADVPTGLSYPRFFARLDYLETSATQFQVPNTSTLNRWRQIAQDGGRFGLVAPQIITHRPGPRGYRRGGATLSKAELAQAGGFRDTAVIRQALAKLEEAVSLTCADVVLFHSPVDFAPSAANRDILRGFFRDLAPPERFGNALRVWEPHGLWELDAAARFAGELGIVLACDPLTNDQLSVDRAFFAQLPSETAYFRITGLGSARTRFDDYALEFLLTVTEAYQQTWIAFANAGKYPDALRLRRLLNADSGADSG